MGNIHDDLKASHEGLLRFGEVEIPCAVLSDGRRVLTAQGVLRAMGRTPKRLDGQGRARKASETLEGSKNTGESSLSKAPVFVAAKSLGPFIPAGFNEVTKPIRFTRTVGGWAHGFPAEILPALCRVYRAAERAGALHPKQRHVAAALDVLGDALMGVGITALVDEATGYQKVRADDALQVKLAAYIAPHLRPWSKFMPDELWQQFARLERRVTGIGVRPKYWGCIVNEVVYDALDPDVARHLRDTRPPSSSGRRYHQWLTSDFGATKLRQHVEQVIAIARTCTTMREFRGRVALGFSRRPAQTFLPLPRAA